MPPIRILHLSDLHLSEIPQRHSLLDKQKAIREAAKRVIAADLKAAISNGKVGNFRKALSNILDGSSIDLLQKASTTIDKEQINQAIDSALQRIVTSDQSIIKLAAEALRDLTFASSYNPGALDCLCNFIEEQAPNLDAIIITGDLATTGFELDLEKVRTFLEGSPGTPAAFDQTIAHVKPPIFILPGNHDRYKYTGKGFLYAPGGKLFESVLAKHWSKPVRVYKALRNTTEKLSVVIVAADFCLRETADAAWPLRSLNRLAQGKVHHDVLLNLKQKTQEARDEEKEIRVVTIWAIHFPPYFPYRSSGRIDRVLGKLAKNLIDEDTLIAAAREQNVSAILAGHTHEADDYSSGHYNIRVLCAGSATQDDIADKHCQIIEISKNFFGQPKVIVKEFKQDTSHSTFAR